jgi:hypothetical protein
MDQVKCESRMTEVKNCHVSPEEHSLLQAKQQDHYTTGTCGIQWLSTWHILTMILDVEQIPLACKGLYQISTIETNLRDYPYLCAVKYPNLYSVRIKTSYESEVNCATLPLETIAAS